MRNFFELFNLPTQFDVDGKALDAAYRNIQRLVHPDRFVTAPEAEKRAAVQYASLVNDAYQTLKDSLKRAGHLCALNGVPVESDAHIQMDSLFLMEQMDWREKLEAAQGSGDGEALQSLAEEQAVQREKQLMVVKECLDAGRFKDAATEIHKLMFLNRFGEDIHRAIDGLASRN